MRTYKKNHCAECGGYITKKFGELIEEYNKRIYCRKQCLDAWHKKQIEANLQRQPEARP